MNFAQNGAKFVQDFIFKLKYFLYKYYIYINYSNKYFINILT